MFALQASPLCILATLLCASVLVACIWRRAAIDEFIQENTQHFGTWFSRIVAILCVPASFFLIEATYNPDFMSMSLYYILMNLIFLAVLFGIVYFLAQKTKASMIIFMTACFIAGVANYFIAQFKGQPILPSDVVAIQTAAEVSGGYVYAFTDQILVSLCVLLLASALVVLSPKPRHHKLATISNTSIGACLLVAFSLFFSFANIEAALNCKVDVWSSLDSFKKQGYTLCFTQRAQMLKPKAPIGYSHNEAQNIISKKSETVDVPVLSAEASQDPDAAKNAKKPAIVAIMGETFSDLSRYPGIDEDYQGPQLFNSIDDALLRGDAYVSALGGGTCNSEFEFLSGSSTGLLGAGVYPYMLYDLNGIDCLPRYLSSLGYETSAIHPANAENWRRDRIYNQLGFEKFYSIEDFDNPEMFRGMTTDAETYDKILEILKSDEDPQFIFDVTYASHSGYATGKLAEDQMLHVPLAGVEYPEFNEYITCIERSDKELKEFMDELSKLDRPVILCFFGDHQPGFSDWLASMAYGQEVEDMDLATAQQRYMTPYMIWTNSDDVRKSAQKGNEFGKGFAQTGATNTSLNYLAADLLVTAGLPLNEYFALTLSAQETMPAINLNGYQDAKGTWHWHHEGSDSLDTYNELAVVQYDNLFDKE